MQAIPFVVGNHFLFQFREMINDSFTIISIVVIQSYFPQGKSLFFYIFLLSDPPLMASMETARRRTKPMTISCQ